MAAEQRGALRDTVSYELYRNTPADVPKDKLETELYIPLV